MAVGTNVKSVFGGPADRSHYGETVDFAAQRVPVRRISEEEHGRHSVYERIRRLRENPGTNAEQEWQTLKAEFEKSTSKDWLQGLELVEVGYRIGIKSEEQNRLISTLRSNRFSDESLRRTIEDGLTLAKTES